MVGVCVDWDLVAALPETWKALELGGTLLKKAWHGGTLLLAL